jgi:hypothetical protein
MTTTELVAAVRKHALEHYNEDGWDYVEEATDDETLIDFIEGRGIRQEHAYTVEDAIRNVLVVIRLWDERRREVQNEIF